MNMKTISFRIEKDLLELVDTICDKKGIHRSELIRDAIEELLRKEGRL
jgi:metal-responsive CopG/Arc/MetJ family transcriptional regulator